MRLLVVPLKVNVVRLVVLEFAMTWRAFVLVEACSIRLVTAAMLE